MAIDNIQLPSLGRWGGRYYLRLANTIYLNTPHSITHIETRCNNTAPDTVYQDERRNTHRRGQLAHITDRITKETRMRTRYPGCHLTSHRISPNKINFQKLRAAQASGLTTPTINYRLLYQAAKTSPVRFITRATKLERGQLTKKH